MTPFAGMLGLQLRPTGVISNADLVIFLIVGVLAGAHRLGMCGPLVGFYADRMSERQSSRRATTLTLFEVRQHTPFNGGRVVGYPVAGVLFALLGGTLFTTAEYVLLSHGLLPLGFPVPHVELPYYQPLTGP